ncbi:hypothetical protein CTI12_AA586080 [Artemisia annua]|uniref:C2 domain-containing protein n=1 Tax=Artemisia annua TaxID=35608 RepID=A0A2U1KM82_ARTAN|nr:hypothetical protein CTI12_AA586080 [Artemisia annua]
MSTHRPPPKPMDLELTIISAKHLKNVNWRNGHLSPYVIFWLDPTHKLATKSDDSNNTKPVWNERFILPVQPGPNPALTLEVFHSKPSDTNKPLVDDVINSDDDGIRSFDLKRPSGRASGKIRLKMSIRDNYQFAPQMQTSRPFTDRPGGYGGPSAPVDYVPPPPPQAQWPGGYGGGGGAGPSAPVDYVKLPPPPPQMPRTVDGYGGGGAGPSAPVDYAQYDQKQKSGKIGLGVGGVVGGMSGLSIDDGLRYEEEKVVESELNAREMDDYSDYRRRVDY